MNFGNREKLTFVFKIFLCSCFFAVWINCLTMFPEPKKKDTNKIVFKNDESEKKQIENIRLGSEDVKLDSSKIILSTIKNQNIQEEHVVIKQVMKPQYSNNAEKPIAQRRIVKKIKTTQPLIAKKDPLPKSVVKDPISKEIHVANKTEVKNAIKNGWKIENLIKPQKVVIKTEPKVEVKSPEVKVQNKIVENKQIESVSQENKNTIKALNFANLNFPTVAGATRKVLSPDQMDVPQVIPSVTNVESSLRKEAEIKKNSTLKENWAPRYLVEEKKHLENKVESLSANIDKISQDIEVTGLVDNENGEKSVVIRDKANNKVVILNKGENYQGVLKILDVNEDEVTLRNDDIEKNYIKKLSKTD